VWERTKDYTSNYHGRGSKHLLKQQRKDSSHVAADNLCTIQQPEKVSIVIGSTDRQAQLVATSTVMNISISHTNKSEVHE